MDMIWPRWTRARIATTAFYSLVGLGLGSLGAPLLAVPGILAFAWPPLIVLLPAIPVASYYLSADATSNTCRKHVCAPQGVAAGMLLGALAIASLIGSANSGFFGKAHITFLFAVLVGISGIAWAWGAHVGGQKALQTHLGPRVQGLGKTCAACGYDLSGAPDHAPCSECGEKFRYARRPEEGI